MPSSDEIPAEIQITGTEGKLVELEQVANFIRDLVFLHDRLWIVAAKDLREYKLDSGYFYMRYGRPVPKDQRLQLVSFSMGSPFSLVFLLAAAGVGASIALPYFKLLRGGLLLPGELKKQKLDAKKIEGEIEINELKKVQLSAEIENRSSKLRDRTSKVIGDVRSDLRSLRSHDSTSLEEVERLITRDVERLNEDEIVVTDVVVRRYRRRQSDH